MRRRHLNPPTLSGVSLLLLTVVSAPVHAAIYTVGAGGGCTHTTIQAAINAAEASAGGDTVRITRSLTYTGQQIFINTTQDLNIVGGFATCTSATSDTTKTVVSAAGPNGYSVFNVSNTSTSTIKFRLLRVTAGRAGSNYGGGINYVGYGTVELIEMQVDNNSASYGGGIYFQGSNAQAQLIISNDTLINGNSASVSGGGIYLQQAKLTMTAPGSSIAFNSAVNYGGGLRLYGSHARTEATVGSNGYSNIPAIYGNEARWGGGVALQGLEDDGNGVASFDLVSGASISNNYASERGGGIDLQNHFSIGDYGDVDAQVSGGVIESNTAAQAAAVYVGHETNGVGQPRGSQIQISGSRVVGNLNVDANNQPTGGATIVVSESGRFNISRSFIQDNVGGAVLRADASDAAVPVSLDHCLVSGNTLQRGVVEALSGAPVEIRGSTIAGNALTGPVITASGNLRLEQAIVWQPGRQTALISGNRYIDDVVASEIGSLVVSPSVILRDPRFVDPQRADYSLQAASPAVDDSGVTSTTDLAGAAHDRDLALVADQYGVGDLGAYELQAIGNLVLNPGFLTDLRIWNVVRAGVSTWISAGANSTGSLKLEYDRSDTSMPPAGTLIGISQCVHIPGPGTYRLTGFAYGDGADNFERDHVSLHWTYRANSGGEACTGAISASGSVAFPSAAGFVAPTASAIIDIPAGQWTEYSTVEIAPAVVEGGFQVLATTTGHFDGIVLESVVVLPDGLFANGFE